MKTKILTTLAAVSLASGAFGQGVIFDNAGNTGNQTATSNGLVYNSDNTLFDGVNYNLGVSVFTSTSAGGYTLLSTFTPSSDSKGYTGFDAGQFQLGAAFNPVNIPGVAAGGIAYFELQIWSGANFGAGTLASDYTSAVTANDPHATVFFSQATSNPNAGPPIAAGNFSLMPSVTLLTSVPEPSTLALAGLGGFGMLMAMRRKKA